MNFRAAAAASLILCVSSIARAADEPWSDPFPPPRSAGARLGDFGFHGGAEYRAMWSYVNPISPNDVSDRRVSWIEHRLRLDGEVDYKKVVRVVTSIDALDGVLWGDNGNLGEEPAPTSGANINTKNVNSAGRFGPQGTTCIDYREGDELSPRSYGYGLCPADDFFVRRAYGEVLTPIGMLRVGRQPATEGTAVALADGDGRPNRFGVSRHGNNSDRILFGTKPLEVFVPKEQRNMSSNEGFFLVLAYDRLVTDELRLFGDDVSAWITVVRVLEPEHALGSDLELRLFHAYRWDEDNATAVNAYGLRFASRFGDFHAGFDMTTIAGSTREVSEAFRVITNDPVVDQAVLQYGARAVVRYDQPMWSAYLEVDYASGDDDPRPRTPLTQFTFAQDSNVGLLLFEHVLAFQSARSAAAATEILRRLEAPTFPVETIDTRGSFTNAFAVFPQVDFRPHPSLLLRGGVLAAWAPKAVVDPIESLQHRDGNELEDDLVNFAGGKPGTYYGTELDGRAQWTFADHFALDLEGAILFPGDALQDENGDAVRSVLVQGRTTFFF